MNNKTNYKSMYLKAIDGISKSIDIANKETTDKEKLTHILNTLISTSLECEDIYVDSCE